MLQPPTGRQILPSLRAEDLGDDSLPEMMILASDGARYERQRQRIPEESEQGWHRIIIDLRKIQNPEKDWRANAHIGVNPAIMYGLASNPEFKSQVLKCIKQALGKPGALLMFKCTAGRHRSVAAATIASEVLMYFL